MTSKKLPPPPPPPDPEEEKKKPEPEQDQPDPETTNYTTNRPIRYGLNKRDRLD